MCARTVVPRHHVVQVDLKERLIQAHRLPQRVAIHKSLAVTEGAHELAILDASRSGRLRLVELAVAALLVGVEDATLVKFHAAG